MRKKLTRLFIFSRSSRAVFFLTSEIFFGMCLIVGSMILFADLAEDVLSNDTVSADHIITHFVYLLRHPVMTQLMLFITSFGGQYFLGTAIITTIIFLYIKNHKKDAIVFSFILFFGIVLNIVLKFVFQRERPTLLPLANETSFSFPSAHSMNSFIFFTCLSFFIFRKMNNTKLKYIFITASIISIGLTGFSRIYLGVHYPSDVIAGYLAGLCWFVLVLLFEKTLLFFHLFKRFEFEKKY